MTLVLFGLGALAAALGTRAASILFVAAAVAGALGDFMPALVVWTAGLVAGLVLRPGMAARRLALPAVGAGAVLASVSSSNAAAVMGLWVIGTAVVCFGRGRVAKDRRWALTVCLADLPLAAAVTFNSLDAGFESWPPTGGSGTVVALLISAAMRLPLAGGTNADNEETALVVVRTQTAALILLAMGSASLGVAQGAFAVSAGAFVLAGLAGRAAMRDAVQELSLLAMAVAASVLGWTPDGWAWGALAAGTLIHNLRVSSGGLAPNVLVKGVLGGAGLGLPFLPVVGALLEGSLRAGSWYGAVTAIASLLGLASRARVVEEVEVASRRRRGRSWSFAFRDAWLVLAVVGGLAGVVLALPRPPGGEALAWPPLWAAAVVIACGLVGTRFPRFAPRSDPRPSRAATARAAWLVDFLERVARTRALEASLALLVAAGVVLWVAGTVRGFL